MTTDAYDWMLEAFGPNGENWIQHSYKDESDSKRRCLLGMTARYVEERLGITDDEPVHFVIRDGITFPIEEVIDEQYDVPRFVFHGTAVHVRGLTKWNDRPERTFSDIVAVIEKARASCDA